MGAASWWRIFVIRPTYPSSRPTRSRSGGSSTKVGCYSTCPPPPSFRSRGLTPLRYVGGFGEIYRAQVEKQHGNVVVKMYPKPGARTVEGRWEAFINDQVPCPTCRGHRRKHNTF